MMLRRLSTEAEKRLPENIKWMASLVCPVSKTPLSYDKKTNSLVCESMQVRYPIVDGIPNLLPESAIKINKN